MDQNIKEKMLTYELDAIAELCEIATSDNPNVIKWRLNEVALRALDTLTVMRKNDASRDQG